MVDKRVLEMCREIDKQKLATAQEGVTVWAEKLLDENAALRDLLERSKVAIWWGVNDEYDHSAKDAAAILLRDIDALLKEEGK